MHDIFEPADPPARNEIPIYKVTDRDRFADAGDRSATKIAGVVLHGC